MATEVRAEMTANVWKVLAKPGDSLSEGDQIVILESMKMEIPIVADAPGTLRSVDVEEGVVVQEGDVIAVFE